MRLIPLDKLDRRYFFESEILFRLNALRAVVLDIPMDASYGDERSNLAASHVFTQFAFGHLVNFQKRIISNYLLRDFHVASVEWLTGPPLVLFGFVYGLIHWVEAAQTGIATPAGTIMLAALPIIVGLQLSLSALGYDIANQPTVPIHVFLDDGSGPQGQRVADARDTAELEPDC